MDPYFAVLAVAVAAWTLTNGLMTSRASFVSSTVIARPFFLFTTVFPSPTPAIPIVLRSGCTGGGIITVFLSRLSAEFSVPIVHDAQLNGFLRLGPKRSGDPYFAKDIGLLTTLISQAASAIQNAELYSQVVVVGREKRRAERLASVGALASGIAHEIKNPLVATRAFAELLPERYADEEFREGFPKVTTREIERLDELVGRLSGLAAAPAERFAPLAVLEPIDETLVLLRGQLELSRISVVTSYDPGLPLVPGDKSQLKQLFLNLFQNAIEAMDGGGQLSVRAYAKSNLAGQCVVTEIADEGKRIPDDMLGRIFDSFVTTNPQGSGLGLSISRGIADADRAPIYARNNRAWARHLCSSSRRQKRPLQQYARSDVSILARRFEEIINPC